MKKYKLVLLSILPLLLLNLTGCYTQVASRDDYGNWNREESKPYYDYEEEADKQIHFCENICKEDPKIDVKEKLDEIRKSFEHILDDCDYRTLVTDAQTEYINTIPFEEYLKYKCGKNAKFNKTTIQRSV